MPWNDKKGGNGGSPWGGGGHGPWGSGGGGGRRPPNPEEILQRLKERLGLLASGSNGGFRLAGIVVAVLFVLWLASGIYRVLPDEQGVVLTFGAYSETTQPGLHYRWPAPIQEVYTPKVTTVNTTEIGFSSSQQVPQEALMLTGDENIVDINMSVFWVVKDAREFLFNIKPDPRNPDLTVKSAAESAVREVVGRTPLATVLQGGRQQVETDTQELLQKILDSYGAGIEITQVQLQKFDPPEEVIEAFRDVQRAQTDKESLENQANAYRNDVVPRARGQAQQIIQDAEAYKQQIVAKAQGDAERFLSVLNAYRVSKDVTAERLYLDAMEQVLENTDKILLDKSAGGVVPYLPLAAARIRQGAAAARRECWRELCRECRPMSRILAVVAGILALVVVIVAYNSFFIVSQTDQALVLEFGQPVTVIREPGLKAKVPFVQNVVIYDRRLTSYEPPEEEVIASDQKRLVVDSFARYRIVDPLQFYRAAGTDDAFKARLAATLNGSIRRVVGGEVLGKLLSPERSTIMGKIRDEVAGEAKSFGVEVVDVRIRRTDLPAANSDAIYKRMQSARDQEAKQYRAEGAELAQGVRADADKQVTVIKADADKQAQILRGQGDAEAIHVTADAYGQDPDFFAFYRSLDIYKKTLGAGTTLVLSPGQRILPLPAASQRHGAEADRSLMDDLLTAVALMLVMEGTLHALFPQPMKRMAQILSSQPEGAVRVAGLGCVCLGVAWVWLIRHH